MAATNPLKWTLFFNILICFLMACFTTAYAVKYTQECMARDYGQGSCVCVCNATYCDNPGPRELPPDDQYLVYISTMDGMRLRKTVVYLDQVAWCNGLQGITATVRIMKGNEHRKQEIYGFGGAFTDATGINVNSLSPETRKWLMASYFSKDGIEYNFGRVPIGGTDFSARAYSYDDDFDGDVTLKHFQLAEEDYKYKIPLIQEATNISHRPLKLLAAPWSAPAWMKTNGNLGLGFLKHEYYQTWANYFVKFFDEYNKNGITFWGVISQNEPEHGYIDLDQPFNSMGFPPVNLSEFIGTALGPVLEEAGYGDLQMLGLESNRKIYPDWAATLLTNGSEARRYVKGLGLHFYMDNNYPPELLDQTHELFPDVFLMATEACSGTGSDEKIAKVLLGSWERAELYAHDIIEDLNHWIVGWMDWNMALALNGGPNWINNIADSPILVDSKKDEFYKQPMFYALAHFSKFILPGARVREIENTSNSNTMLEVLVAHNPDDTMVMVILNKHEETISLTVQEEFLQKNITSVVPKRSILTFVWHTNPTDRADSV